jgi:hypothetical protein
MMNQKKNIDHYCFVKSPVLDGVFLVDSAGKMLVGIVSALSKWYTKLDLIYQ